MCWCGDGSAGSGALPLVMPKHANTKAGRVGKAVSGCYQTSAVNDEVIVSIKNSCMLLK